MKKCLQCNNTGVYRIPSPVPASSHFSEVYCNCELGKHIEEIEKSGKDKIMFYERMEKVFDESGEYKGIL